MRRAIEYVVAFTLFFLVALAPLSCTPYHDDPMLRGGKMPSLHLPDTKAVTFYLCYPLSSHKDGIYFAHLDGERVAWGFAWKPGLVRVFTLNPMTGAQAVTSGDTLMIRNTGRPQ